MFCTYVLQNDSKNSNSNMEMIICNFLKHVFCDIIIIIVFVVVIIIIYN